MIASVEHVEQRQRHLDPPWNPWEAVPIAVAVSAAIFLVALVVVGAFGGTGGYAALVISLLSSVAFAGVTMAWIAIRYRRALPALGLHSARPSRDLAVGAWVGAGLFGAAGFLVVPVIQVIWEALVGSPPPAIDQQVIPVDPSIGHVILGMVAVVIGAPIGEEVFFRGFLFGSLRSRLGFVRGAAISSLVFAAFHYPGGPVLVLTMIFVGAGFALLYHRRGSLVAPIAAHAMFNIIGYTLMVMST